MSSLNPLQTLIAILSLSAFLNAAEEILIPSMPWENGSADPRCTMVPEKGPCKAIFWKYTYDPKTNQCKEFMYGGCEGTVPFETKEECVKMCVEPEGPGYPIKKPAIYLYPTKKTDISVSLRVNGTLTTTIPPYNGGWKVSAEPNGAIKGGYDYLFYEADLKKVTLPKEGWIVEYKELNLWFDINLAKLGLNAKEKQQFKEYWINELPSSPYYKIQLLDMKFLSDNMGLDIHPKPDTLIRLDFYFTPLKELEKIDEPAITTPERKGFTVIEWGGILDDSKYKKVR